MATIHFFFLFTRLGTTVYAMLPKLPKTVDTPKLSLAVKSVPLVL